MRRREHAFERTKCATDSRMIFPVEGANSLFFGICNAGLAAAGHGNYPNTSVYSNLQGLYQLWT